MLFRGTLAHAEKRDTLWSCLTWSISLWQIPLHLAGCRESSHLIFLLQPGLNLRRFFQAGNLPSICYRRLHHLNRGSKGLLHSHVQPNTRHCHEEKPQSKLCTSAASGKTSLLDSFRRCAGVSKSNLPCWLWQDTVKFAVSGPVHSNYIKTDIWHTLSLWSATWKCNLISVIVNSCSRV